MYTKSKPAGRVAFARQALPSLNNKIGGRHPFFDPKTPDSASFCPFVLNIRFWSQGCTQSGGGCRPPLNGEARRALAVEMSLRNKIILLFGGVAVVPLLAMATFGYSYAQGLLRTMIRDQLNETARTVAQQLDQRSLDIGLALDAVVDSINWGESKAGLSQAGSLPAQEGPDTLSGDSPLARVAFVQIRNALGPIQTLRGVVPDEWVRCLPDGTSQILEFSREISLDGSAATVTAGFWASDLVSREGRVGNHRVLVLHHLRGTVLYADHCPTRRAGDPLDPKAGLGEALTLSEGTGPIRYEEDGESRLGVLFRMAGSEWTILATSGPTPMAGSLNRLGREYWLFVLGLGIFTALAFFVLLGRFTRSFRDLTGAPEEIGAREIDPWLPVPTAGELGQPLVTSKDLPRKRIVTEPPSGGEMAEEPKPPSHLMTPEGLEAVLALAPLDPEEVN